MGVCNSLGDLKQNDKDVIKILWPFNSSQAANLEQLKKLILKANIEIISNLNGYLESLKSKKEEISNENEVYLICFKSDAENNAKLINEIPTIVTVFPLGKPDRTFSARTGRKFYSPFNSYKMMFKSCLDDLEKLRFRRNDRKNEENNKIKNPLSPTINRDNPEVDEFNLNNNPNVNSKSTEKEKPVIIKEEPLNSLASMDQKTKLEELVCSKNPTLKRESDTKSIKNTIIESAYNNAKLPISDTESKAVTFKNQDKTTNKSPTPNNNKSKIKESDDFLAEEAQKPVKETCIEYVFIEILFDLFERGKACSIEAQEDFLVFCHEEGRNKKGNSDLDFNIMDFLKLRKLLENADFDKENLAFDVYFGFPFVKQLCAKALKSCDFYAVFRLRFILNYFFKKLQEKMLSKEKEINNNIKNASDNSNARSESHLDRRLENDHISFKSNKVIYSKNELLKGYKINDLFDAKGKIFLANDFTACFNKANLNNLFFDALKNKNDNKENTEKNIIICSYFLNSNNSSQLNYENESKFKKDNLKIPNSINKEANEDSANENVNSSDLESNPNSVNNVEKLNLNIMQSDFQRVFCIFDYSGALGASMSSAAPGGKRPLTDDINKDKNNNKEKTPASDKFQYLVRNNVFLRVTDIISKTHLIAQNPNLSENITNLSSVQKTNAPEESKAGSISSIQNLNKSESESVEAQKTQKVEYFEVIFELQKDSDLPAEYQKTLTLLSKKLSHILSLEYDNDYLYLFDILTCLDMNKKVIELIEDLLAKDPTPVEDELHSVEDKKFFMAQNLYYLGEAYAKSNQIDQAIKIQEESLKIKKGILREDHPEYVLSLNNLSSLYFSKENYAQALDLYLECMHIEEKYLSDKTNPNLGITYNNIATVHNKLNNFEDALKFYFKNYEIEKINYGENSLECAATLNNIGIVYDNMGDFKMALGYYRDALRIREELCDEDDAELGNCYNNLAVALDNEGNLDEAVEYYRKSLNILRKHCDEEHPDVVTVLGNISVLQDRINKNANSNINVSK